MNDVLTYLDMSDSLLCSFPTRALINGSVKRSTHKRIQIRVDRTMPFEFIANLMSPFCRLWEADIEFDYSDYDAALAKLGGKLTADVYIICVDWRIMLKRMSAQEAVHWLHERIKKLRLSTNQPIFVNNWPEYSEIHDILFSYSVSDRGWIRKLNYHLSEMSEQLKGTILIDLAVLSQGEAASFYDYRNEATSSYPFSNKATISIARHLGVHLLPAAVSPRIKAIALDLDDTLYNGVLGEDGFKKILLTEGHLMLQRLLLRLKQSGILLTLCSRNHEEDVKKLFAERDDFPLKWNDFAAVAANWRSKAENLDQLAHMLNIDPSAFLFVDDNPAELVKMAAERPDVHLFRARRDGHETMYGLSHYPGLYQLQHDEIAASRTVDIQANQIREKMRNKAADDYAYLKSLEMRVTIYENNPSHVRRLHELSRKTNQFNLALKRMTENEINEFIKNRNHYLIVTIALEDVLSSSGIIGAFVCRIEQEKAYLMETLFSCRALGREIETVTFSWLLERLQGLGVQYLYIDSIQGPRNAPALDWLGRFAAGDLSKPQILGDMLGRVKAACKNHPAKVEVNP
ncbi:HAD-IIIC family phosphatase [Paenibacillus dakarensis]|uniref:HAD-IIIC family phosphatase n=1 Tax=Paenibacillus dakarensis TaxID=1527293 RepID=UPI0006D5645A|nr:HAD-IIIC family phosphatase [Paenibacillus dakarensis]